MLWLLRLALAPMSTLAGFRAWVVEECPVAPGRRAPAPPPNRLGASTEGDHRGGALRKDRGRGRRPPGSSPWPLNSMARSPAIPVDQVGRISAELAPQVGLNTGAARAALRKAVLAAQDGDPR